jgi:hypothetical protein
MLGIFMDRYFPSDSWGLIPGINADSFAAGITFAIVALIFVIWVTYWKFHAIWKAVHHNQKIWVVVFLLVNTLGILEILYIHVFSKYKKQ